MVCVHDFWIWAFFFVKMDGVLNNIHQVLEDIHSVHRHFGKVGGVRIDPKKQRKLSVFRRERAWRRERKIITKWESTLDSPLKYMLSSLFRLCHLACCSSLDGRSRDSCTWVPMVRLNLSSFRSYQRTRLA